jgi:hypothetical protein
MENENRKLREKENPLYSTKLGKMTYGTVDDYYEQCKKKSKVPAWLKA